MKKLLYSFLLIVALATNVFSQTFTHGFAITSYDANAGDIGNVVNVQGTWNDAAGGTTLGMYSWTFDVTSADATIAASIVPTLNSNISGNFDITIVSITGGKRITVTGKTTSKYLIDNGGTAATYNTVKITFTAPSSAGPTSIVIVNNASGVKRLTSSAHTPSAQSVVTNTKLTVTINTSVPQPVIVPPTTTDPVIKLGAVRKFGDINWDGNVDIADITALLSVARFEYSTVSVASTGTRPFYSVGATLGFDSGEKEDISDSTVADVSTTPGAIDLLDVAVLQDAVLNAEWPDYAGTDIKGKPLQKIGTVPSILCEISDAGTAKARVRISLVNNNTINGVQLCIPATYLNKNIAGYSLIPTAKFSYKYNSYENLIAMSYQLRANASSIMVLQIPYITVDELIAASPEFILSKNNQALQVGYQVKTTTEIFAPSSFILEQNYPNPFNPSTVINYTISEPIFVHIGVFNALGQEVETLVLEAKNPGNYSISWDATNSTSGLYIVRMETSKYTKAIKAILLK